MGDAVVLINVSFGLLLWATVTAALLIPATAALVHVKVAPLVLLVGEYVNDVLLQIAVGVNVLLNVGVGYTVTVTF
jgi:hypothetical protein